jgi:pimeloyl-ACP methyl ester carboxylesterase
MPVPRLSCRAIIFLILATLSQHGFAARVLDERNIAIDGERRRYFHLHDGVANAGGPVIVLIDGSGCGKFSTRLAGFFDQYAGSLDVYFLEKAHIANDAPAQPETCLAEYERADRLERRVADIVQFLEREPRLKAAGEHSIALLGFSDGGAVAPQVAANSRKIGRLAVIGAGGMKQSDEFRLFAARGVQPYAHPSIKDTLDATFADIARHPMAVDKRFFGHSYSFWSARLFHDPLATYARLDIPVVVAMGEKDESVPIESGRLLQRFFAQRPGADFTFFEFPEANHGLAANGKAHLKPFIARLVRWFKGEPDAFAGALPDQS